MNENVRNKIKQLSKELPKNVGIGWGRKIKNNKYTGEKCVVFFVKEKKPVELLTKDEKIPSFLTIEGKKYKTDVVELGEVRKLTTPCYPSVLGNCPNCDPATRVPCYQTWCPDDYDPDDNPATKAIDNQDTQTYLCGGIQISSDNLIGHVGTLGMIAVDNETNCLVGVTNNHVIIGNAFYTTYRNVNNVENESDDNVYQNYIGVGRDVGKVMRYVPIRDYYIEGELNSVDAAIFSVKSSKINLATIPGENKSWEQFGLSNPNIMAFATTQEIDDLVNTNPPLYSSGRTTGPKEGTCALAFESIYTGEAPIVICYDNDGNCNTVAAFTNVIMFTRTDPDCPYPIAAGDSGSALIADFSGTWKIVGLCFAGSAMGMYGLACRIDEVASQLNISAWNGITTEYIDVASQEIKTIAGQSSDKTITCGGKTYWQIGAGATSNPC